MFDHHNSPCALAQARGHHALQVMPTLTSALSSTLLSNSTCEPEEGANM